MPRRPLMPLSAESARTRRMSLEDISLDDLITAAFGSPAGSVSSDMVDAGLTALTPPRSPRASPRKKKKSKKKRSNKKSSARPLHLTYPTLKAKHIR